ncbi:MAG: hypothetical protein N5P05_001998 [Chroococcopsis gigantea SAG 12.99]|jgi:hypothetical protein|nr:hypothetical protein [Chlorogloea purpurea SAG 13.99]MDV3000392.1 hypothetical protein [Chroococcopsis gigantea SAG 12.99]
MNNSNEKFLVGFGDVTLGSDVVNTEAALLSVGEQLRALAVSQEFDSIITSSFGHSAQTSQVKSIQEARQKNNGDTPLIKIVPAAQIAGARGAYVGTLDQIFLSKEFIDIASREEIADVLLEEIGHAVDYKINAIDTTGDEGELFAALLRGKPLEQADLDRIKLEDDTALININGQSFTIEQSAGVWDLGAQRATLNGLDNSLAKLQETLINSIANNNLLSGLIGDNLNNNGGLSVLDKIRQAIQSVNPNTLVTPAQLATALNNALTARGLSGISFTSTTINTEARYSLNINTTLSNGFNLDTDLKLPKLGFNLNGGATADVVFNSKFDFGTNLNNDAFFLDTSAVDEFKVNVNIYNQNTLNGRIGFLPVTASNSGGGKHLQLI